MLSKALGRSKAHGGDVARNVAAAAARPDVRGRRDAIRGIIRQRRVSSQDELRILLRDRGHDVTQATLSRDLAALLARRVTTQDGSFYELADAPVALENEVSKARDMVLSVSESLALVVILTSAGAASVVANHLDRARWPEILGTIAGDDTIFVAPAKRFSVTTLASKLRQSLSIEA
jgi:transcriptional regulator of arginine metabolism